MSRHRLLIEIDLPEEVDGARVRISADGPLPLAAQMVATEHMMTMFAAGSDAGFERALELLCEGARTNHVKVFGGNPIQ